MSEINFGVKIAFSILLCIGILLSILNTIILDPDFYSSKTDDKRSKDVISFFEGNNNLEYLTSDERFHMKDVRNLIDIGRFSFYLISITLIIMYLFIVMKSDYPIQDTRDIMFFSSGIVIFCTLLSIVIGFDRLFIAFHHLFFPQGNWIFPEGSELLRIFPKNFFVLSVRSIVFNLGLIFSLLTISATSLLRYESDAQF